MSRDRCQCRTGRPRQGFTLVELLFAIVILLFVVVFALRIFPPGFEVFNENQRLASAQAQTDGLLNQLEADAAGMPDAITPLDFAALYSDISALNMNNITSVAYTDSTAITWAYTHRFPSDADPWPGWQPLHTRLFRRVVGEKFAIPADIRAFGSNPADSLAIMPKYSPRFAPMQTGQPIHVYDLRYQRVAALAEISGADNSAENLIYYVDATVPGHVSFYFAQNTANDRDLRITLQCKEPVANGKVRQLTPAVWELTNPPANPISPTQGQTVMLNGTPVTATVTVYGTVPNAYYQLDFDLHTWNYIPGSEQINRAYHRVTWSEIADPEANLPQLAALAPGRFYIWPEGGLPAESTMLLAPIIFSKTDAGKRVKIDYTVADWGILRDDATVADDGYLNLSTRHLKVSYKANFPREPKPWGLFEPMNSAGSSTVMALVNTIDGTAYTVEFDPAHKNADLGLGQKGYYLRTLRSVLNPKYRAVIDLKEADRGRVRVGLWRFTWDTVSSTWVPAKSPDWNALEGQVFRVYYRAQRDWTVQAFRAPATFAYIPDTLLPSPLKADSLGLMSVTSKGTTVYVNGLFAGQTLSCDYLHREMARVTEIVAGSTVRVDAVTRLAVGNTVWLLKPGEVNASESAMVTTMNPHTRVVSLTGSYTSLPLGTILRESTSDDSPLWRASGEVHTVPQPDPVTGVSTVVLAHQPAVPTRMVVRGTSMTVRTLWTQPRRGEAMIADVNEDPGVIYRYPIFFRPLGDRWRQYVKTIVLPTEGR